MALQSIAKSAPASVNMSSAVPVESGKKDYTAISILVLLLLLSGAGSTLVAVGSFMGGDVGASIINQISATISFVAAAMLHLLRAIAINTAK